MPLCAQVWHYTDRFTVLQRSTQRQKSAGGSFALHVLSDVSKQTGIAE